MRISLILLFLVLACEFVVMMGVSRHSRQRRLATKKPQRVFHRHVRQAFRNQLRQSSGVSGTRRSTRAFPSQTTRTVTLRPTVRASFRQNTTPFRRSITARPVSRLQAPPRQTPTMSRSSFAGPPGIKPPRGMADTLNRARLKDFMSLGQFLLRRQRLL